VRIGILADTHGLLRPRVLDRLRGCELLLHAGDVGTAAVLAGLAALAPVVAVRGDNDRGELAALPAVATGSRPAYRMTHRREDIAPGWTREARLVVFGHSHRPELGWEGGCLLLNPGGCGRRRFRWPLTVAVVTVRDGRLVPEILEVE
jgi:putative phosphoesterase